MSEHSKYVVTDGSYGHIRVRLRVDNQSFLLATGEACDPDDVEHVTFIGDCAATAINTIEKRAAGADLREACEIIAHLRTGELYSYTQDKAKNDAYNAKSEKIVKRADAFLAKHKDVGE